jgi:thiamine biosynthesis lipoprotein
MSEMERYEYTAPTMGTMLKVALYAENEQKAEQAIEAGLTEIERLIPFLNNYDPASEISRLASKVHEPVALSHDLGAVLGHAKRWHELSDGAFDVTVGPLTRIWSTARRERKLPTPQSIAQARLRSGWNHIRRIEDKTSDLGATALELLVEGMRIDVSGIATGYIIDQAFEKIREGGIDSLLIDIGGDIRVGKSPPASKGWRIDVAGLGKDAPPLSQRLLENCAVTTSGDLNQFVEIDGVRYSHLIDPRTGHPVPRRQSATAIATTAIDADAGATALCVLGMEQSANLFENLPLQEGILLEMELHGSHGSHGGVTRYRHFVKDRSAASDHPSP